MSISDIAAIAVPAASALFWLAYKHPSAFQSAANKMLHYAFILACVLIAYWSGQYAAVLKHPVSTEAAQAVMTRSEHIIRYTALTYFALLVYTAVVVAICNLISKHKRNQGQ